MKKAVALLGAQRRQNTFRLLGEIGEILAKHGIALEVIELYRYDIQFLSLIHISISATSSRLLPSRAAAAAMW